MSDDRTLASFVLRIVRDEDREARPPSVAAPPGHVWHGVIKHVQSDAQLRFSRWDEAIAFIAEFVDITE